MEHSQLGASSCYRWLNCPGSYNLSKDIIDIPSEWALEGSAAHVVLEMYLNMVPANHIKQLRYVLIPVTENKTKQVSITEEMIDGAKEFSQYLSEELNGNIRDIKIEEKVTISSIDKMLFGTADVFTVRGETLYVFDYKYGEGKLVEVENNYQLMFYALGVLDSLSPKKRKEIKNVNLYIHQPRRPDNKGNTFRKTTVTLQDLRAFKKQLRKGIQAVYSAEPAINPGEWCGFCSAKGICVSYRDYAVGSSNELLQYVSKKGGELKSPDQIPIEDILPKLDRIKKWVNEIEKFAFDTLMAGKSIPGYKLVHKKTNRKWRNPHEAMRFIEKYLDSDKFLTPQELRSPSQIEKMMPKDLRDKLSQFWENPEGGPTIAPVNDSREDYKDSSYKLLSKYIKGDHNDI